MCCVPVDSHVLGVRENLQLGVRMAVVCCPLELVGLVYDHSAKFVENWKMDSETASFVSASVTIVRSILRHEPRIESAAR